MEKAYLLLGSNLGDSRQNLKDAVLTINAQCGEILRTSSVYRTAAWGRPDQPGFLNQAVIVATDLTPADLLAEILKIELLFGRERIEKWGSRTLDIDILFYGDRMISQPDLEIPHPLLQQRRFVLTPLNEIAPGFIHPVSGLSVNELLERVPDDLEVEKLDID